MEYRRIPYSVKAKSVYLCLECGENKYEWLYIPLDGRVGFPCRNRVSSALSKDYEPLSNRFVAVNSCIYKVGIPSRLKEMHILDIKTGKWKKAPSMIEARNRPRIISIGNDICVMGGRANRANGKPNDPSLFAEFYSHALNKWTPLPYLSPKFEYESRLLAAAVHPPNTTSRGDNNNNENMVIVGSNEDDRTLYRYHVGNQDLVKLQSGPDVIFLPIHPYFAAVVVDYKLIWFSGAWLFVYDIMQKCVGSGKVAGLNENFLDVGHDCKILLDLGGGHLCLICLQDDDVRFDSSSSFYPEMKEDGSILYFFIITVPIFTTEEEGDGDGRSIHAHLHSSFRRKIRRSDMISDALLV